MEAAEVVMHEVKRNCGVMVLNLLADESVRDANRAVNLHAHRGF